MKCKREERQEGRSDDADDIVGAVSEVIEGGSIFDVESLVCKTSSFVVVD